MAEHVTIRICRIDPKTSDLSVPAYTTEGSAGMDLCAAVEGELIIEAGETVLVPTGFSIELPQGYEAQVRPRSGLAIDHRVGILNAPGTIDSDYRGEIKVILSNFGQEPFTIRHGDRIAQLVISRYVRVNWDVVDQLGQTQRGEGGFGHTGISNSDRVMF